MKKIIAILSILILTFSLVACNNGKTNENNNLNNQIENVQDEINQEENVQEEHVHDGEVANGEDEQKSDIAELFTIDEGYHAYSPSLTIRLHENEGTEFSWYLTGENDEKVVKVEDLNVQGESHVYKFTGVSKGEKSLTFKYMKNAEDETFERLITFVFDVNENKEIALSMTGV